MVYNMSNINGSGIVPLIQTANEVLLYDWYGNLILIALFTILYMAFIKRTDSPKQSIAAASFITSISATIFITLGFILPITLLITWIITAFAIALMFIIPD